MEYSQSKYEGSMEFGRYHGKGVLHLPDGYRYEGEFQNGEFHGRGTLFFPEGKLEGQWACGKVKPSSQPTFFLLLTDVAAVQQVEGTFTFSDGLEYAPKDWAYCTEANRQYYSESVSPRGILPTGELNYFDTGVHRVVPLGSYDAGNGIYTPSTGLVTAYNNPSETRQPSEEEKDWILKRAPKATTKDMSVH